MKLEMSLSDEQTIFSYFTQGIRTEFFILSNYHIGTNSPTEIFSWLYEALDEIMQCECHSHTTLWDLSPNAQNNTLGISTKISCAEWWFILSG